MATDKLFSPSVARPSLARSHSSLASLCDAGKTTPRDGSPQTQSATQSGLSSPPPMTVAVAFAACECSECGRPLGQSSITFMAYDNKYCSQVCRGRAMSGPRSRGDLVPILSAQRVWYPANAVGCEEQEALRAACAQRPRASPTATPPQRGAVTTLRACSQQRGEDGPDTEASLAEEAAAGSEAALPLQTLHLLKRVDMCSNWRPRRRAAAFRRSCVELLSRCQALLPPRAVRCACSHHQSSSARPPKTRQAPRSNCPKPSHTPCVQVEPQPAPRRSTAWASSRGRRVPQATLGRMQRLLLCPGCVRDCSTLGAGGEPEPALAAEPAAAQPPGD